MEHWFQVLTGRAAWTSPAMFFPEPDTLGYSYSFFFQGMLHAAARFLGADLLTGVEIALILCSILGYVGFHRLFAALLGPSVLVPLLAAGAAFPNQLKLYSPGYQFHPYTLYPWILLGLLRLWRGGRAFSGWTVATGLSAALLAFSGFYLAFFGMLLGGAATAIFAGLLLLGRDLAATLNRDRLRRFFWAGVVFLAGLVPFFVVHLPGYASSEPRSFLAAAAYLPTWKDLFSYGQNRWFGWVPQLLAVDPARAANAEFQLGITPLLSLAALGAGGWALWGLRRRGNPDPARFAVIALVSSALLFWILLLGGEGERSWWHLVWDFVPGAKAVRSVYRLQFTVVVFAFVAVGFWARGLGLRGRAALCLLAACIVLEQNNTTPTHGFSRAAFEARMNVPPPPGPFLLADPTAYSTFAIIDVHTEAMLRSQRWNLPTLNGYSANTPPGWRLWRVDRPWVGQAGQAWSYSKGLRESFTLLRRDEGLAAAMLAPELPLYRLGTPLDLSPEGNVNPYVVRGLYPGAPDDAWTDARGFVLAMRLDPVPTGDIELNMIVRPYDVGATRTVHVAVNGEGVFGKTYRTFVPTPEQIQIPKRLIPRDGMLTIELGCDGTVSPQDQRQGLDVRPLGVRLKRFVLDAAAQPR